MTIPNSHMLASGNLQHATKKEMQFAVENIGPLWMYTCKAQYLLMVVDPRVE